MFKEMILKTIKSGETRGNRITDGKYTCAYGELPEIFANFAAFFTRAKISSQDCCIFNCGNSVPEALLLLWLLYEKRDFVLLPPMGKKAQREMEQARLPQFCRLILSVDVSLPGMDIKDPGSYIDIAANGNFREEAGIPAGFGSVFLRTSGSTAEPKLVKHTNEKLTRNAANAAERLKLQAGDRIIIPVPVYHMYGLGAGFLPGVITGAAIHLVANTNVIKYLDQEKRFKPNVSFMTPPLCEMLLRTRKRSYHYRLVVTAGDRIGQRAFEQVEKVFGPFINLYGSTELGVIATSLLADPLDIRSRGIIAPLPGVEIHLESKDEEEKMSEIICRHDYGLDAYVDKRGHIISRDEQITRFNTKDLGQWMDNDKVTFKVMGRTGNSINRSGILVSFSEVESLMEQGIAEIDHAVVIAKGDGEAGYRGKKLLACCQLKPGTVTNEKEIRSRCFPIMMRHMVPDEVVIINEIPRLPNGKFDRKSLKKRKEEK
jgi:acyl-coenzyme A synthetase/AMP-(fatty) acid ligase